MLLLPTFPLIFITFAPKCFIVALVLSHTPGYFLTLQFEIPSRFFYFHHLCTAGFFATFALKRFVCCPSFPDVDISVHYNDTPLVVIFFATFPTDFHHLCALKCLLVELLPYPTLPDVDISVLYSCMKYFGSTPLHHLSTTFHHLSTDFHNPST